MINLSRIVNNPRLGAAPLVRVRRSQTVGANGRATNAEAPTDIAGIVTMDKGAILERIAEAEYVTGSILVHTTDDLRMAGQDADADLVQWKGSSYTVTAVGDYSAYGFMWAICEPVSIPGVANA